MFKISSILFSRSKLFISSKSNFSEYKKLLVKFFQHLRNSKEIWSAGTNIYDSASSLHSILKDADENSLWISIDPPWVIPIINDPYFEQYDAYLVLGGEIKVSEKKFEKYNFYCSIVRRATASNESKKKYNSSCELGDFKNYCRIVRRFHFDTGEGIPENLETKSHLQFRGICQEKLAITNYEKVDLHYCLDNKIRVPRFPYPPISIIELLDILLRQFRTSVEETFIKKKEWAKLVIRSEDFRLEKYYSQISDYYKRKNIKDIKPKTLFETLCEEDCIF